MITAWLLVVLLATGLPAARWLLPPAAWRASYVFLVACIVGLIVQLAAAMALTRLGGYSRGALIATLVAWTVLTAASQSTQLRRALLPPRLDWFDAGIILVAIGSLVTRRSVSYFLFETGDMGEYVNRANVLADGGSLIDSFPHGFTYLLANTHQLAGERSTVEVLPILGVLIVMAIGALSRSLGAAPWASVAAAAVAVAHPMTTWYAQFPVSEQLAATFLVAGLALLAIARDHRSIRLASLAGIAIGLLLFVRISGLAWLAIAPLTLLASWRIDDPRTRRAHAAFVMVSILVGLLSFAYNVRYAHGYFVDLQLVPMLPARVVDLMSALGFLSWPHVLVGVSFVAATAAAAVAVVVRSSVAPAVMSSSLRWGTGLAVTSATTLICWILGAGGLVDALDRWGWHLLVLGLVGCAVLFASTSVDLPVAVAVTASMSVGFVLFAHRLPDERAHSYYLYWDRYLFDSVFPFVIVLAALGITAIVRGHAQLHHRLNVALATATIVAVGGLTFPLAAESAEISSRPLMGDTYVALQEVSSTLRTYGGPPIVFTGPPEHPSPWFFPNVYRAFALPLAETFDHQVLGLPTDDPFSPDPRYDEPQVAELLLAAGSDRGAVVRVRSAGADPIWNGHLPNRSVPLIVWLRLREVEPDHEYYRPTDLVIDVYVLEDLDASAAASSS